MLLIAKSRKWQLVSSRHPSMCISGGIGDQTRHIRRSYVVSKRQTDWLVVRYLEIVLKHSNSKFEICFIIAGAIWAGDD